ncbi:MAG: hypothetical protein ACLSFW_04200 [Bacteroides cellulosilyticus]
MQLTSLSGSGAVTNRISRFDFIDVRSVSSRQKAMVRFGGDA